MGEHRWLTKVSSPATVRLPTRTSLGVKESSAVFRRIELINEYKDHEGQVQAYKHGLLGTADFSRGLSFVA